MLFEEENETAITDFFKLLKRSLQLALCIAVDKRNEFLIRKLLQEGADPNIIHQKQPLLHHIVRTSSLDSCLDDFMKHGADVNAVNEYGESSLHFAVQEGDDTMLQLLLKYGGNPFTLNIYGQSPLNYAATFVEWNNKNLELLHTKFLFDINRVDFYGNTILHNVYLTQEMGTLNCNVFYYCLLHGANFEIKNTALQYPQYFCTCCLRNENPLNCPVQNFLNIMLKLHSVQNVTLSNYVQNFLTINVEFQMLNCNQALEAELYKELKILKNISIKGRFINGSWEKKQCMTFYFLTEIRHPTLLDIFK